MKHRLLLADDSQLFLNLTSVLLTNAGYQVDTAISGTEVLAKVANRPHAYSAIVLDYRMGGKDGAETAHELTKINPKLYTIIYSADSSRDALLSTWKAGAVAFVDKSADEANFLATVRQWCQKYEHTHLTVSVAPSTDETSKLIASVGMVGRSEAMAAVARDILRFRTKPSNVLILGESGTGKELVARALHPGSAHLFKPINCAAYNNSTEMMEAELFGADKGAYTGADTARKGVFETANGGTVFLDEIHLLSISAQQKLLRTLQEKTVRPLGTTREIPVNFRLVAAAKPELEEMVRAGQFLLDLFYRLYVLRIDLPPLRDRPEDIEPLVAAFCHRYSINAKTTKRFLARTVRFMEQYRWPGNVRELEHTVERLCASSEDEKIAPEHLDGHFFQIEFRSDSLGSGRNFKSRIENQKREDVLAALQTSKTLRAAARKLGIPHSTFHDLVKRYGISKPQKSSLPKLPKAPKSPGKQ